MKQASAVEALLESRGGGPFKLSDLIPVTCHAFQIAGLWKAMIHPTSSPSSCCDECTTIRWQETGRQQR